MKFIYLAIFTLLLNFGVFAQESRNIEQYFYKVGFKDLSEQNQKDFTQFLSSIEGIKGIKFNEELKQYSFTLPNNKSAKNLTQDVKNFTSKTGLNITNIDRKSDFQIKAEKEAYKKEAAKTQPAKPIMTPKGPMPPVTPMKKKTARIKPQQPTKEKK